MSDGRPALPDLLAVARGDSPADLVLRDARVVDVLGGTLFGADVAIQGERVAGVGVYRGRREVDLAGAFVAPGFIDAHLHVESAMVPPAELSRAVAARGTTTLVCDPHEIANVAGLAGVRFMLADAERAACDVRVMAPSCVPASALETNGASLAAAELAELAGHPRVLGLAEVMSYPAVVAAEPAVLAKLATFAGRPIDGHAPALTGGALNAYAASGIGSDHECTTLEEAREKLRLGLTVFIREASGARNLRALLPLVAPATAHRVCFCTDDRQPGTLLDEGHVDSMVRAAIAGGADPVVALQVASWSAASHYGLTDRGVVAPGRRADLVVFDDLISPAPRMVFIGGRLVAEDGEPTEAMTPAVTVAIPDELRHTVRVDLGAVELSVPHGGSPGRVIGIVPDQLTTRALVEEIPRRGGAAVADGDRDLARIAVVERHRGSGRVGQGFVRGLGLRRGALASTVAHDHHNLIVAGVDEASMRTALARLVELGGGLAVAAGETVLAEVPLPIAGLMSDRPIGEVRDRLHGALAAAVELGSPLADPFTTLSFLGLEVIPSLRLTDLGLVDVDRFELVPLWT